MVGVVRVGHLAPTHYLPHHHPVAPHIGLAAVLAIVDHLVIILLIIKSIL